MGHDNFQPPDSLSTEEAAELANVMPLTLEEAYTEGRADEREQCATWCRDKAEAKRRCYTSTGKREYLDAAEALDFAAREFGRA